MAELLPQNITPRTPEFAAIRAALVSTLPTPATDLSAIEAHIAIRLKESTP